MCSRGCLLPVLESNLCPVHYVSKIGKDVIGSPTFLSKLDRWVKDNSRYQYEDLDEVFFRNNALHLIYGDLPSYAYFSSDYEFVEKDYTEWWKAVLKDLK